MLSGSVKVLCFQQAILECLLGQLARYVRGTALGSRCGISLLLVCWPLQVDMWTITSAPLLAPAGRLIKQWH